MYMINSLRQPTNESKIYPHIHKHITRHTCIRKRVKHKQTHKMLTTPCLYSVTTSTAEKDAGLRLSSRVGISPSELIKYSCFLLSLSMFCFTLLLPVHYSIFYTIIKLIWIKNDLEKYKTHSKSGIIRNKNR